MSKGGSFRDGTRICPEIPKTSAGVNQPETQYEQRGGMRKEVNGDRRVVDWTNKLYKTILCHDRTNSEQYTSFLTTKNRFDL